jgi:transforming growth factor-beta-induced protein
MGVVACGDDDDGAPPAGAAGAAGDTGTGGTTNEAGSGNLGGEGGGTAADKTIVEIAAGNPDLSILVAAATKAGLVEALGGDNLTVFAPTNKAFEALLAALGADSLDDLSAEQLKPILLYHVAASKLMAADVVKEDGKKISLLGGSAAISTEGGAMIDGAKITKTDIMAKNGVVHLIDKVILPSITDIVVSDDRFSSLEAAVVKAELAGTLDDDEAKLTAFAPVNAAFTGLVDALKENESVGITKLEDFKKEQLVPVLLYHVAGSVLPASEVVKNDGKQITTLGGKADIETDGGATIDGAKVTIADIYASNGIIHVIDKVILPNIPDVVTTDPQLKNLTAALGVAEGDLVGALSGAGPFTVFAPTDTAFGNVLTANELADLPALVTALGGADDLADLLTYHVLDSAAYAADVVKLDGKTVTPLAGGTISIKLDGGKVILNDGVDGGVEAVNDSEVQVVDILTANGVIHKLSAVIKPPPAT